MKENVIRNFSNSSLTTSVFAAYFGEQQNAMDLFNALESSACADSSQIVYLTPEQEWYGPGNNNLAFTIGGRMLVISEEKPGWNNNVPIGQGAYYARAMEFLMESKENCQKKMLRLPCPRFYVFCNGAADSPPEEILRLSDAYEHSEAEPSLELLVKMININPDAGHPILERCPVLKEYAILMESIRMNLKMGNGMKAAVGRGIDDCRRRGIAKGFLDKYGSLAGQMMLAQLNMEAVFSIHGNEERAAGKKEGMEKGRSYGKELLFIILIRKKMQKGWKTADIAELLETEIPVISDISRMILNNPDYNDEQVLNELLLHN